MKVIGRLSVVTAAVIVGLSVWVATPAGAETGSCEGVLRAVVTDIDETLTSADAEWLLTLFIPSHDPAERASAAEVFTAYADRGYWVVYVTARPDGLRVANGATSRASTLAWLEAHGFPTDADRTYLYQSPDLLSTILPRGYKGAVIQALQGEGFGFDFAYGNADTDFQAFFDSGIPAASVYSVGERAGWGGSVGIPGPGYEDHLATHVPTVDPVCDPDSTPPGPDATCPAVPYDGVFAWLFEQLLGIPQTPHVLPCH